MTQGISEKFWQAEARTKETKQFIKDIKRITRRKFIAEEKIRIVLEGFRQDTPIRDLSRLKDWLYQQRAKVRLERDRAERRQKREEEAAKRKAEQPALFNF